MRVVLVQSEVASSEKAIIFTANNAIIDAASATSLYEEFLERYLALEAHDESETAARAADPSIQYRELDIEEALPQIGPVDAFLPSFSKLIGFFRTGVTMFRKEGDKQNPVPLQLTVDIPPVPAGMVGKLAGVNCACLLLQTPTQVIEESVQDLFVFAPVPCISDRLVIAFVRRTVSPFHQLSLLLCSWPPRRSCSKKKWRTCSRLFIKRRST